MLHAPRNVLFFPFFPALSECQCTVASKCKQLGTACCAQVKVDICCTLTAVTQRQILAWPIDTRYLSNCSTLSRKQPVNKETKLLHLLSKGSHISISASLLLILAQRKCKICKSNIIILFIVKLYLLRFTLLWMNRVQQHQCCFQFSMTGFTAETPAVKLKGC